MKKIVSLLVILGSMCSGFAQPLSPVEELKDQGVVDPGINRHEDLNSPLLQDLSIPVVWGVAATGPSLQLGNLVSLNVIKEYQTMGHPIAIYVDTETAGLDPAGSPGMIGKVDPTTASINGQKITAQIRALLGPDVQIYSSNDLDLQIPLNQLLTDVNLINLKERMSSPEISPNSTLADLMYPLNDAYVYEDLAQKLGVNSLILVGGEDQKGNMYFSQKFLKGQGVNSVVVLNGLLMNPTTGEKMGKRGSQTVNINDPSALSAYVDKLSFTQLTAAWRWLATGPMPNNPKLAQEQLKAQLLAVAKKVGQ